MAFEQRLDLVSPKPQQNTGFFSPQQQQFLGGIGRGISSAFSPAQKQAGQKIGEFLTTPVIPAATTPTPTPVAKQPAPMNRQTTPQQPVGMVDLGGGSSITSRAPLSPAAIAGMQRAAIQSTPEQLERRARDAALSQQNLDESRAWDAARAAPQGMGMQQPAQVAPGPDYSGAIENAIATLQSSRPSGSFDRQIEWKNKVGAAKDLLGLVGGMQTSANQTAANTATDQQRIAAAQEEARQRTALGMGQLASEDQYRQDQVQAAQMGTQTEAQKYADERAMKQQEANRLAAAREALAQYLEQQGTGTFFDDPEKLAQARLARVGGINADSIFAKPKAQ